MASARMLAAIAALALVASAAAMESPGGADAADPQVRRATLLVAAERALATRRSDEADAALEAAALLAHAADTETLQVRSMMQQGRYRQAASLAAHTAGDHHDGLAPVALYAWLLALAGQESIGVSRLEVAQREAAGANPVPDPIARAVMGSIADPASPVPGILLQAPHRFAPYVRNFGDAPSKGAEVVTVGVSWDEGRRALVPVSALRGDRLWVRNGLGDTVAARFLRRVPGLDLALLELATPLSNGDARWAMRDPFAGSPGFVADYPAVPDAAPAWPRLRHGFLGGASLSSSVRRLGIALYPGSRGGAVFDKYGRVAGVAIAAESGVAVLLPVSQIRKALEEEHSDTLPQQTGATMSFDEGYEQAMRMTLQVIAAK